MNNERAAFLSLFNVVRLESDFFVLVVALKFILLLDLNVEFFVETLNLSEFFEFEFFIRSVFCSLFDINNVEHSLSFLSFVFFLLFGFSSRFDFLTGTSSTDDVEYVDEFSDVIC